MTCNGYFRINNYYIPLRSILNLSVENMIRALGESLAAVAVGAMRPRILDSAYHCNAWLLLLKARVI